VIDRIPALETCPAPPISNPRNTRPVTFSAV
jgi:hypothetical protein